MRIPVALSGEAASISRWWRLLGGVLMTLALGTLYALERICHAARKGIWMEAGADFHGLYVRGRDVCRLAASRRQTSGPLRTLLDFR